MTTLDNLVRTPLARALGQTLFHSLWEGALIGAILFAALSASRSARTRYTFACAAMLALLGSFGCTLIFLLPEHLSSALSAPRLLHHAPPGTLGPGIGVLSHWNAADALPWLAPFWLVGVILFHLRSLVSLAGARRLRNKCVCPAADFWQGRIDSLRATIRLRRTVELLESSLAVVPVALGVLRPVILLPVSMLAGMPIPQIEAILLHELAHIRRRDYLANLLQTLIEGFLFYHPASWWISGVVREERENCCDDLVVATSGNNRDYAAALTALEASRPDRNQLAMASTGGSLVKRIRRLLYPQDSRMALAPGLSAIVIGLGAAVALIAWQVPATPSSTPVTAASWNNWVVEDVAYIITDAERKAFRDLTTDAERQQFAEQFWQQRDPTPGTPRNEFKEEHYRRIAWVNDHFVSDLPGWKTDRGRIYITFGPPDEIDSHPSGGSYARPQAEGGGEVLTHPFEVWRYRFIAGIGKDVIMEFVDSGNNGIYRMTMDPTEKYVKP